MFSLVGNAFGDVIAPTEEQVRDFLTTQFQIDTSTTNGGVTEFVAGITNGVFTPLATFWGFGGIRMGAYDVSGFVDPTGVVQLASHEVVEGTIGGVIITKQIAHVFERGETIGPSTDFDFSPTVFYPTIPNKPVFFGLSIDDPFFGWIEVSLVDGVGTVPTVLAHAVQPLQNVPSRCPSPNPPLCSYSAPASSRSCIDADGRSSDSTA